MSRIFIVFCGILGSLAVALGAFGAHGLRSRLASLPDGAQRLEWWNTAAQYNLTHALALGLVAWLAQRDAGLASTIAGACFVAGVLLFSGSLYAMTLSGETKLGMITPLGGTLLLAGWLAVLVAGLRLDAG